MKFTQIFLRSNYFTGQIPSLSELKDLNLIDLRFNNLRDRIPNFLTNLTRLTKVYLSYNHLTSQIGEFQSSWLQGTIPLNSTLFLLSHLQLLNLAFNDFELSLISSGFGQFTRLRYLNLLGCVFSGQVPLHLSHLSLLASLDLSQNHFVSLETFVVRRLAKNLKMLRELHLDLVDMSSVSLRSLMNFSSSLTTLSLFNCELQGTLPVDIFCLPNLLTLTLMSNIELRGFFPLVNLTSLLRFLDLSYTNVSGELPKSINNLKFLWNL